MAFTPLLLVRKTDLDQNKKFIVNGLCCGDDDMEQSCEYLNQCFDYPSVKFPEIELYIIEANTANINEHIRKILTDLKIYFRLSN